MALRMRPKIRLQSDVVQPTGTDWTSHGAPRASRPCGRLPRCAARSLDPCSRRDLSTAKRRRQTFVASLQREGFAERFIRRFLLDGGVQIPC